MMGLRGGGWGGEGGDERVFPALVMHFVQRIVALILRLLDGEDFGFVEHRTVEA